MVTQGMYGLKASHSLQALVEPVVVANGLSYALHHGESFWIRDSDLSPVGSKADS